MDNDRGIAVGGWATPFEIRLHEPTNLTMGVRPAAIVLEHTVLAFWRTMGTDYDSDDQHHHNDDEKCHGPGRISLHQDGRHPPTSGGIIGAKNRSFRSELRTALLAKLAKKTAGTCG